MALVHCTFSSKPLKLQVNIHKGLKVMLRKEGFRRTDGQANCGKA